MEYTHLRVGHMEFPDQVPFSPTLGKIRSRFVADCHEWTDKAPNGDGSWGMNALHSPRSSESAEGVCEDALTGVIRC